MSDEFDYDEFMGEAKKAFQPYSPIELVDMFQGRSEIVERVVDEITTTGRHIILYGDRGVGKTSLANHIGFFAKRDADEELIVGCYSDSTFSSIFLSVLNELGHNSVETSYVKTKKKGVGLGPKLPGIGFNVNAANSSARTVEPISDPKRITPAVVSKFFADRNATIVIDEYDRVEESSVDASLSETIKRLSDLRSNTKIIVVGVAESAYKLISRHDSLDRSCAQIHLPKMSPTELENIVDHASRVLGLRVPFSIRLRMIDLADGYPYFMHLLGLKICEAYARRCRASDRSGIGAIGIEDFQKATELAVESSEETLRKTYEDATRSDGSSPSVVRHILDGLAIARERDVAMNDLLYNIRLVHRGKNYSRQKIQSFVTSLCKDRRESLLVRVRSGVYKFDDPRMRAFVRISLQKRMPSLFGGQLPLFGISEEDGKLTEGQQAILIDCFSKIPNQTTESITYSTDFDVMYDDFVRKTGGFISKRAVWRHLQNLRKKGKLHK